ncbi:MAG TPA: hypothetical protein VJ833_10015 [Rhodanobacteraceae bacterium]|nr:hypothetical protein [Rhodanobacteraceae bacterium]
MFPILPRRPAQAAPTGGNPKPRSFNPTGLDGSTGPSYSNRRSTGPVIPASGRVVDVRRFGVAANQRGEWKR